MVVAAGDDPHAAAARRAAASAAARGALGRNLTVHPATAVWGVFDETVDMSRGVPQSYYVDEFAAEGFVFEGIAGPPDYLALAAPFAGDALRELMLAPPPRRPVRADGQRPLARPRARACSGGRSSATTSARATPRRFHAGLLRLTELMGPPARAV